MANPLTDSFRTWSARPCKEDGYQKTYSTTTEEGDQLELDVNYSRQMVRIRLEVAAEHGRMYMAVIKNGFILHEKDVTSRRPVDLTSRMLPFRRVISQLKDFQMRRALGTVYGLPSISDMPEVPGRKRTYFYFTRPRPFDWLRNYIKKNREKEAKIESPFRKLLHRIPSESFDFGLGVGMYALFLFNSLSIAEFALLIGSWGIFSGAVDWLIRQRDPFLPKVFFFVFTAGYLVHQEIQYRIWSIFL